MTLFAKGNIMQLLEGDYPVVTDVFEKLRYDAKQIGIFELLKETLAAHCLSDTSIGYSSHELGLISKFPKHISVFKLHPVEVEKRMLKSPAKVLLMRFASDHG
jgi:hypothetical protein